MSLPVTVDRCRRRIEVHVREAPHKDPQLQRVRELKVQQLVAWLNVEQLHELCGILGLHVPKVFNTFNGKSRPLDIIRKYVEQRGVT